MKEKNFDKFNLLEIKFKIFISEKVGINVLEQFKN
jgi:hypothetical protein